MLPTRRKLVVAKGIRLMYRPGPGRPRGGPRTADRRIPVRMTRGRPVPEPRCSSSPRCPGSRGGARRPRRRKKEARLTPTGADSSPEKGRLEGPGTCPAVARAGERKPLVALGVGTGARPDSRSIVKRARPSVADGQQGRSVALVNDVADVGASALGIGAHGPLGRETGDASGTKAPGAMVG